MPACKLHKKVLIYFTPLIHIGVFLLISPSTEDWDNEVFNNDIAKKDKKGHVSNKPIPYNLIQRGFNHCLKSTSYCLLADAYKTEISGGKIDMNEQVAKKMRKSEESITAWSEEELHVYKASSWVKKC
jgi:hypothetical protein